jgi:hypothetical protein
MTSLIFRGQEGLRAALKFYAMMDDLLPEFGEGIIIAECQLDKSCFDALFSLRYQHHLNPSDIIPSYAAKASDSRNLYHHLSHIGKKVRYNVGELNHFQLLVQPIIKVQ